MLAFPRPHAFALIAVAALSAAPLSAATKTWIGGTSTSWALGSNWQGGVAPVAGDSLVFPANSPDSATNDLGAVVLDSLQFSGDSEVDGGTITLSNASAVTSNTGTYIGAPITLLAADPTFDLTGPSTSTFTGQITLNGGTFTINGSSQELIEIDGGIGEMAPSSMTVTSGYEVVFEGPLTISGPTTVSAPIVIALSQTMEAGTAPIIAIGTNMTFGITMHDNGPISRALDLRMSGPSTRFGIGGDPSTLDYSGPISITGPQQFWISSNTTFSGPISGNGRLVAMTSFTIASPSNSFSGGLEVQSGATLAAGAVGTIPSSGELVVDAQGTLAIGSFAQTVQRFTCAGTYSADSGNTLTATDVNLNGCSLQLTVPSGFNAATSSPIRLITNSGSNAVSGTFAGLTELAPVVVGGVTRYITYRGGDGNDVELLATNATPTLSFDSQAYTVGVGGSFTATLMLTLNGAPVAGANVCFCGSRGLTGGAEIRILDPATATTDSSGRATFLIGADSSLSGTVSISGEDVAIPQVMAQATVTIIPHAFQDMWWSGSSENGWGFSLIDHGDILFGALYVYDSGGKPTWYVIPDGAWDSTALVYTGSLYSPTGSPFYSYDASRFAAGNSIGMMKITFQDADHAILDYTINGVTDRKFVSREIFGNGSPAGVNRSDLWWGGTSQNGWGITVLQQGSTLFPVWFTYDANGKPTWYVMPGGTWNAAGDTYSGGIYRTTGSPWLGANYDPTKLDVIAAGTYSIKFNSDGTATFNYTADDHSGTMNLVREPF